MLEEATAQLSAHLPFFAVGGALAIVGYVLADRFLTVDRATRNGVRGGPYHWMRESLPLAIILLGAIVGALWVDPEDLGKDRAWSIAYFTLSAVVSLPFVAWARARGYTIMMPGDTDPPCKG